MDECSGQILPYLLPLFICPTTKKQFFIERGREVSFSMKASTVYECSPPLFPLGQVHTAPQSNQTD